MNKKYLIVGLIALILLFCVVIIGVNKSGLFTLKNDPIKLGFINPMSGAIVYTGEQVRIGFELAHSLKNKLGYKEIVLIEEDDKCDAKEAVFAINKLLEFDNVNIVVDGTCSSSVLGVSPIMESKKKILLSPVAASPKISNAGEYIYRISSSSEIMAKQTAEVVYNKGIKKIGILYEQNDYPVGWKESFIKNYSGEVIFQEPFGSNEQELKTIVSKIKDQNVDAILITILSVPSGQKVLREFSQQGITKQLIGSETFAFKQILSLYEAQNMWVSIYDFDLNSSEMKKLFNEYQNKYGKLPDESIYVALGYDSYNLIYNAISSCKSDNPECIKNYLDSNNNFSGASGKYNLDKNGDAIRKVILKKIVNNGLVNLD